MPAHAPIFTSLTGYSTTAQHYMGEKLVDPTTGKIYMYGKAAQGLTNSTLAANEVVVLSSASAFEFTNDLSDGVGGTAATAIGICRANGTVPQSTSSVTYYCWFQIGGFATIKTNGDNNGVAGDGFTVVGDGTADVVATAATSADGVILRTFATAVASEAASACAVVLHTMWL